MDTLYDMLMQVEYLPTKNELSSRKSDIFCKFHEEIWHNIKECEEFHQKVIQIMTYGLLQIEKEEKDNLIGMISFQGKKIEVCRLQHTESDPLKLVLTRLAFTHNENYNSLPHNYGNPPNVEGPTLVFQTEIDGLTRCGKCFTSEELEKQWIVKGKEVVDAIKGMEVNKFVSEEEAGEFLKLMKRSQYSMIEKLKKTPVRIFMISFILSFKPYRNAL